MYDDIEMESVVSSNVARIGFSEKDEILKVEFLNGGCYVYKNFSNSQTYEELKNAPSVGQYFNANIKNSYPYEKLG